MFGRVAPRYDLLNHLLSFNLDKRWRRRAVDRVQTVLARPGAKVLDLACGTGDVLLEMDARRGGALLIGSDFCHPMLVEAQRKMGRHPLRSRLFEADALALPVPDNSLDLITIAFGFRNLVNYEAGLRELHRTLKPEGLLAILEFSQPSNPLFGALYGFFSTKVLPKVGGLVSRAPEAYSYLPESIQKFPGAEELAQAMGSAGYGKVEFERMTGGAVALHLGWKT
jgi:demethylmenaquinone methyltransferase/2-methoxy-6-polyprenyl-1,4-benzoquinol methylase